MTCAWTTTESCLRPSDLGPPKAPERASSSPKLDVRFFVPGSFHSTLRANPFPEVTDLICRLPLPTLFYRLEAFHLGDLMRI